MKSLTKILGTLHGYGITAMVRQAYEFLIERYEAGDRILLFGFSRGAHVVRILAAVLETCGVLHPEHRNLVPYAIEVVHKTARYQFHHPDVAEILRHTLGLPTDLFKATFSIPAPVHFLGLWDCVEGLWFVRRADEWPLLTSNPGVMMVRHALAIDERRVDFTPSLWRGDGTTDAKQVWFVGAHSDVGGGYDESVNGLSKISLSWMLSEAKSAGLLVDEARVPNVLPSPSDANKLVSSADPFAPLHDELSKWRHFWWVLSEMVARSRRAKRKKHWRAPLGRGRGIPEGSLVHSSVVEKMRRLPYRPRNLPARIRNERGEPMIWQ